MEFEESGRIVHIRTPRVLLDAVEELRAEVVGATKSEGETRLILQRLDEMTATLMAELSAERDWTFTIRRDPKTNLISEIVAA